MGDVSAADLNCCSGVMTVVRNKHKQMILLVGGFYVDLKGSGKETCCGFFLVVVYVLVFNQIVVRNDSVLCLRYFLQYVR